jgi:ABC-type multidrug transport system ATPase subunit
LDSTSAVSLVHVLRELALQGKTIITSIHQPSSQIFQSFDQLILLADGKTIFMVNIYFRFDPSKVTYFLFFINI